MLIYSFDCAQHNMGFTAITHREPIPLPAGTRDIAWLEQAVITFVDNVNSVIKIEKAQLIDLGGNPTLGLRRFLDTLAKPDVVVYEFQMNINDKSRMISHMISYHFAYCKVISIGGAEKNKVCIARNIDANTFAHMCPNIARKRKLLNSGVSTVGKLLYYKDVVDLSHRNFLRITNKNYDGNKLHTSAMFEYWNTAFSLGYTFAKWDDVADSFIQCLAVFPNLLRETAPCLSH